MTRPSVDGAIQRSPARLLSAPQRRLLALLHDQRIEPRQLFAFDVCEPLDVDRMRTALGELVDRHKILRTYYPRPSHQEEPSPVIATRFEPTIDVVALDADSAGEQQRQLAALFIALQSTPSPLDERPFAAFSIVKLAEAHWRVMGALPAINADGESVRHLVAELETTYRAADAGAAPATPRFQDVAAWMSGVDDEAVDASGEAFWRGYLADTPWRTQLPIEKMTAGAAFRVAAIPWDLPRSVQDRLAAAADADGSNGSGGSRGRRWLERRLIAAAAAWVSRFGDSRRVFVGVACGGRRYQELRRAVGPYDQVLPVVVDIDERATFGDLEERIERRVREVRDWQDWFDLALADTSDGGPQEITYPIAVDVRDREAHPHNEHSRLVAFTLTNLLSAEDTYGFKLTFELEGGTVRGALAYNAAVYTPAAARRVRQQLSAILEEDGTDDRVVRTQRPGVEELEALMTAPVDPMPDVVETVHQRFERQAAARPDAIALIEDDRHVSYAVLDALANRLAQRLRTRCATGPESLVAIERTTSLDAAVAILATLKTGSAFVPLDPDWPVSRTAAVLRSAAIVAVLAGSSQMPVSMQELAPALVSSPEPKWNRLPRLECDSRKLWEAGRPTARELTALGPAPPEVALDAERDGDSAALELSAATHPAPAVGAANLAYVLYTSGTSGVPKGAMITHGGLANYLAWAARTYDLARGRGAVVHSPLTFDFTLTCLLGPLIAGGCVHVCHQDHPLEALADVLSCVDEVSAIKLTPSSIDPLCRLLAERGPHCRIGHIIIGGEALSGSRQLWWLAQSSGAAIVNEYGPTECVVGSSIFAATPDHPMDGPIPIGGPIGNTTLSLLGRDGHPAATWAEGELFIGGHGVARGYVNNPALTAASFVPRTDGGRPGERVYRTGDLARTGITGDLIYLGRRDSQVKVRGYRIELTEVEQAIRSHPAVAGCVATVIERTESHPHLIAFIVTQGGAPLVTSDLREHLRAALPAYMVPSEIHVVPTLPVTAHGKVDVQALQAVLAGAERAREAVAEPRSEVEQTLHRLWREVLQRERIGIDDDFFELGGDSILSIQFLARAHDMGLRLRPRDLEHHPTIRGLAAVAGRVTHGAAPVHAPRTGDVPLAPMQRRFFEWKFAEPNHYNQSVLLAATASVTAAHVEQAIRAVVEHHDALRLAFETRDDGTPRQVYDDGASRRNVVTSVDASSLSDDEFDERLKAIAHETQRSIDLHAAPLMRAVHCSRGEGRRTYLYVVVHHLIVDHVSWTILLDDLRNALDQAVGQAVDQETAGGPIRLPSPTSTFGAWIEHVGERAAHGDLSRERAYWLGERWKSVPNVRIDNPGALSRNLVEHEDSVSVSLGRDDTQALVQETPKAYHTRVLDLLVTAYAMAYAAWSGARVQSLDLEGHGRDWRDAGGEAPDITRTIGWFTALHPVYLRLTRPGDVRTSVQEVKEALRAVPANGAGYGLLRELATDDDRQACRALHRPGVAFNYLGQVEQTIPQESSISWVPTMPAANRASANARTHVLDVGIHISAGQLHATFTYGRGLHQRTSIVALADAFRRHLTSIVAHCSARQTRGYTPSDFPLAGLTQETLDALVAANPDLEDVYPLSDTQKGMLFHATRETTARAYVVQLALVLSGRLDERRFEESWRKVIARHAALRTSFVWESVAEPLQIVHRQVDPSFVKEDWRIGSNGAGSGAQRSADTARRFDAWLIEQRQEGLDLTKPPYRFALLRLDEERYQFVWLYHHILMDGWSTINVLREVLAFYAEPTGKSAAPAGPEAPYRDYIAWLNAGRREASREYWRETMAGVTSETVMALPKPDRTEDASPRAPAHEFLSLGAAASEALLALARRLRVTPNVLVEAAWGLVLSRYARSSDVVFGVTVSGRPHDLPDVEHRVGLFMNTLPMRIVIDRRATLETYVKAVNRQLRALLDHCHVPLVEVQRLYQAAQPERLFESVVVFENFPTDVDIDVVRGELDVEALQSIEQNHYPMTMLIGWPDGALGIKALFDRASFDSATIQQILGHFMDTLRWMTTAGDAPIGTVPAAWSRREAAARATSDPALDPAWALPLHELFERQVALTPDATAVVDGERLVSYRALNRRANQLARHLTARGVREGAYVAICLERSVEMIHAVLATLKAGATYVPIDSRFPEKRIQLIAGKASTVITDRHCRNHFPADDPSIVDIDRDADSIDRESAANVIGIVTPLNQTAYLIHTSGSSGQPKGAFLTHENVIWLLAGASEFYPCGASDVWPFFHSIAFDLSVWEIFGALLSGGRVVVTPYWTARAPEQFVDLMEQEQATILTQTPSSFQQLVNVGRIADPDRTSCGLHRIVFAGEPLRIPPVRDAFRTLHGRGVQCVNMYGITETTVHVTHRVMDDYEHLDDRSVFGRALPRSRVHLLDDHSWPVPYAVAGEICVAGDGVATGYADAPRLTAERFVPSPFADEAGRRVYRSADIARAAGDDDAEYLGRGDRQIKIRGFRVELDEIRVHLLRQPSVRDALVRAEEDHGGDRVLVAYVIPAVQDFSEEHLWAALRQHLPEHMVPAAIKTIDRFPLTPNGKIDFATLARIPGKGQSTGFVPPQTWEEEVIADVWSGVLGALQIGIRDSFFNVGGDSIKALRVIAGLRSRGFVVTTEQLFQHPTIAELARVVIPTSAGVRAPNTPSDEVMQEAGSLRELMPPGAVDIYPATQLQLGMMFHAQEPRKIDRLFHNVTLLTLQAHFEEAPFRRAVDRVMANHAALRTAFEMSRHPLPLQVVYGKVTSPVTVVHLEGLSAAEQRAWLDDWFARERRHVFDITAAPLIRFHVAVCGDDLFALGVSEHHAVLDGWSIASLLAELFQEYKKTPAPDRDVRQSAYQPEANACRGYVLLERTALASPEHRTFWADYFSDLEPLQLPARQRDATDASDSSDANVASDVAAAGGLPEVKKTLTMLDASLTKGLRELARATSTPLKSVVLAAHLAVISYISNSANTMTGIISHGRPETEDAEKALGLFLNTLPLRVRVEDVSWKEWIRAVFEEERRVLPYRRYPLAAMRDRAGQQVDPTTAFNYTHFHVYDRLEQDTGLRDVLVEASTNFKLLTDFSLMSRTAELGLTVSWDTAAFSDAQITSIIQYYLRCLTLMVADPEAKISACALEDDAPQPAPAAPSAASGGGWTDLVQLLATAEQSAAPERIAVIDGERHLTYGELWRQVRALAARLGAAGIAEECPVAVLMDKSLEWIVAALAIVRAGGVYAPIDLSDPPERIHYIASHIGAPVVLTDARGAELLQDAPGETMRIDPLEAGVHPWTGTNAADRLPRVAASNLAYMLYTSGSTGQPKGVAMHQGAIANLLNTQARELPLTGQRILQYASPAFDVSIQEIFTALSAAGTLLLVPSAMRRDFVALARFAAEEQAECLFGPDTVIRALMMAARASGIETRALATIVSAGEPLIVDTALTEFMAAGGELHNHYGPTESHVVTTTRIAGADGERPSIGREIDHTHLFILDRWLRHLPLGATGEIYIASRNVARGYHRAPRLTAERFVPLPYGAPGTRVFKTGDLGYRNANGNIVFKGRSDTQVKLRGYRIELDEIRHAILRDARISDAVVSLVTHDGEKRLRAYIVAAAPVDADDVRTSLAAIVPKYMVPASIVQVPAIPATRNGKVDHAALAAIVPEARAVPTPRRPATEAETQLVAIWQDVLGSAAGGGAAGVGAGYEPDDDFLDVGGDSILLLKLQLKIQARFAVSIPLSTLGLQSTLERMSRSIEHALAAKTTVGA